MSEGSAKTSSVLMTRPGASVSTTDPALRSGSYLPAGTRFDEFEITGLVGEGGFSVVYRARDHQLARDVAIKEYMPSSIAYRTVDATILPKSEQHDEAFRKGLENFLEEARLLAGFEHPALVKVHRFWELNGSAYMVMPLYAGATLRNLLKDLPGPPDEAWLMRLLSPLLDALAAIHEQQCYHRDVAPDNILVLARTGQPLLLDFGAARRVVGDMTQALTVILKPGFAPIEQYASDSSLKQGAWTDIYALAGVVYYCITGKAPPPAVSRLLKDTMQPLETLVTDQYSPRFLAAIGSALSLRPEDRPASVAQFRALLGLVTEAPIGLIPKTAPGAAPPEVESQTRTSPLRTEDPEATVVVDPTARRQPVAPSTPVTGPAEVTPTPVLFREPGPGEIAVTGGSPVPAAAPSAPASMPPANIGQPGRGPARLAALGSVVAVVIVASVWHFSRSPSSASNEKTGSAQAVSAALPPAAAPTEVGASAPLAASATVSESAPAPGPAQGSKALSPPPAVVAAPSPDPVPKAPIPVAAGLAQPPATNPSRAPAAIAPPASTAAPGIGSAGPATTSVAAPSAQPAAAIALPPAAASVANPPSPATPAAAPAATPAPAASGPVTASPAPIPLSPSPVVSAPPPAVAALSPAAPTVPSAPPRPRAAAVDQQASALKPGMEIGGTSLVRFGDRAVRLPEGDWRVVASEAYGLHWDDPGGAFPRTRVAGWSLRLTQSSGPMARGTLLLWLATEQSQFFERLSWENEFCEKSRAGALFHENRGSYNQPECLLVQRTSAALALGPAQSLVAQLGGPLSSREGDLLVSYARHSRGAYLRVMALLPGQGVPDANAVAHGKAIASALQPLGGLQSRTAQWPMPPQL